MKLQVLALVPLLVLSSCEPFYASGKGRVPAPIPSPTASPSPTPSPEVTQAPPPAPRAGRVLFQPAQGYAFSEDQATIARAERIVDQVIQSACFESFVGKRALIDTNGRTPAQVASHLKGLAGVVPVHMYYRCMRSWRCPTGTSAVAYRPVGKNEIWLNQAVFNSYTDDAEWAATLSHEGIGHLLGGYDHSFNWTPERDYSVPYTLGGSTAQHGGDAFSNCYRAQVK